MIVYYQKLLDEYQQTTPKLLILFLRINDLDGMRICELVILDKYRPFLFLNQILALKITRF